MKNVSLYIDLAFCLIVMPVMAMIFPIERWFHNFPIYVTGVGVWLYALYFINRFLTLPWLFAGRRKAVAGAMLIVFSFVLTLLMLGVTLYTPKPSVHDLGIDRLLPNVQQYQQAVWSLFMIVETFSFAVGLLTQTNLQRSRRRAVEAERERAEIELYKAQIKPHFMFNTLNSLYGLFLTQSPNALESLEKFISMMRYIHSTSLCDRVPLAAEADYIRQYVDLQSLRVNAMTEVELDISIVDRDFPVPPMLLVTFVENCFKHGISPVKPGRIVIALRERNGRLEFTTSNAILRIERIGEHLGIENCRKRLGLLYPGRHKLDIYDADNIFYVKLTIELHKND